MTLLLQLSDPHIGAEWAGGDPVADLEAAVATARELEPPPDAVLVTGDLADHAADAEYERLRELLAPLGAPVHVLAGNHDDRAAVRRHFGVPGAGDEPVQYAVDVGPLRLVVLDSTTPGRDDGELDDARLAWLDGELRAAPHAPTLVALHHPPLAIGIPAMDDIGLAATGRRGLAAVIERHPQVRRIVAGHVHRTVAGELAGCGVLALTGTYAQFELDFGTSELRLRPDRGALAVHAVLDGQVVSHVVRVR
jgi:3',5'-cyclic AMP phosphodiesterase CpdA